MYYQHRLAYCDALGIDIAELVGVVRHTCDNPSCVNPEHLVIGTHQDNMDDRNSRKRQARGERSGRARLSAEDVAAIRSSYVKGDRELGGVALGRKYGCSSSHISRIVSGDRNAWRD